MAVERPAHVVLTGLEVVDLEAYDAYRAAMAPILRAHGGAFGLDFDVARVRKAGPGQDGVNRVFTLAFPDTAARERFFADEPYRRVRAEHYDRAVARSFRLGILHPAE